MRKLVTMYRAEATAAADNDQGFEPGNRHTLLIFIGDYSNQYDWQRAERIASDRGWLHIEFDKAGRISAEQIAQQDPMLRQCYAEAKQHGESMIAYASSL